MKKINSAQKGARFERQVIAQMKEAGLDAKRVPLSGSGIEGQDDGRVIINARYYGIECKKKKKGWATLYEWTAPDRMAVIAADRKEPLVVLPLTTLLEMLTNEDNQ